MTVFLKLQSQRFFLENKENAKVFSHEEKSAPLKDLFLNRVIEFDYSLEELKILYSNLNIPAFT